MKKILKILAFQLFLVFSLVFNASAAENCGQIINSPQGPGDCNCAANGNNADTMITDSKWCCGYYGNGTCRVYEEEDTYGCGESLGNATVPDGAVCSCDGAQWTSYWQLNGLNRGICCGFATEGDWRGQCLPAPESEISASCGEVYLVGTKESCNCGVGSGVHSFGKDGNGNDQLCCGWLLDDNCSAYDTNINNIEVGAETLNALNPITIGGGDATLTTPGAIISKALRGYLFPIAGIILFFVLLLGGFQMLTGAASSKGLEEGKQKITSAIIGFILLFASYWIVQLLELIFGIGILS